MNVELVISISLGGSLFFNHEYMVKKTSEITTIYTNNAKPYIKTSYSRKMYLKIVLIRQK